MRQALRESQAALALALASVASIGLAQQPSDRPYISRLYGAAIEGRVEKIQEYLRQGDKVNEQIKDGYTPLHVAALQGGLQAVEALLAAGADPNIAKDDGETPLHLAIAGDSDIERVKALVMAGAKLDLANNEGMTPVRMAAIRGQKAIYEWLLAKSGGKEPTAVSSLGKERSPKTTREVVADLVTAEPKDRRALVAELAFRGDEVMPEVLRSIEGGTPLYHFYDLFNVLGDKATAAMPLIIAQLPKKDQAFMGVITIDRLFPGAFDELPEATKKQTAESLLESLKGAEPGMMSSYGNDVLVRIGEAAAPSILELLRHPNSEHRRRAISPLKRAKFADEQITAELIKLLNDENLNVRTTAAQALGMFGEPTAEVRAALLALLKNAPQYSLQGSDDPAFLKHRDWKELADHAAPSLGRFGPDIIDELLPLLTPLDRPERLPAITALVRIGAPGVPRLIELIGSDDRSLAEAASGALSRIGAPAAPALAGVVRDGDEQVVERAILALRGMSGTGRAALPALQAAASDGQRSDKIRTLAAHAALKVDATASRDSAAIRNALPALIRVLETGEFKQRGVAAEALRIIGPPAKDALPALRKQLELPSRGDATNDLELSYVKREVEHAITSIRRTEK